jgi:branched-chain amino acid transport system substrate-binding protein
VLGNIGDYSGTGSSLAAPVPDMLQRWATQVNNAGGINGHPVKVISKDAAANPAQAATDVQQLVNVDHVIGLVGDEDAVSDSGTEPFLDNHKIPVIGGEGGESTWYTHPMYFAGGASPQASIAVDAKAALAAGVKKLALIECNFANTCGADINWMRSDSEKLGIKAVNQQTVNVTATQFSANCLAAQSAGADGIFIVTSGAGLVGIMQACAQIGYHPTLILISGIWSNALLGIPGLKATGTELQFPYVLRSGSPALQEWGKIIQGVPQAQVADGMSSAFVGAKLAQAALQRGVPSGGTPTNAEVLKGLYALKGETLGGLSVPLTYTPGKPSPQGTCAFVANIQNQKIVAPNETTPSCG